MKADLICIGDELLSGLIENSNVNFLAGRICSAGITVRETCVVADDQKAISAALKRALAASGIVILTGGLGPTDDDVTREAVAETLGLPLVLHREWLQRLENFFAERGFKMPENNRKQALVIEGGELLENTRGTAPGILLKKDGKLIVMLPGPPNELHSMFDHSVIPVLSQWSGGEEIRTRILKCTGIGESRLEEMIKAAGKWDMPPISFLAKGHEVHLQIKASGDPKTAAAEVDKAEDRLRSILGRYIYGCDDDTLPGVVAGMLTEQKLTLALAESCTGGLLSHMITNIPGSSKFYRGALVTYSKEAKIKVLGLSAEMLEQEGVVSAATAGAMAERVREALNADIGIGITGIAGPKSDNSGASVGLVYISISSGSGTEWKELKLVGGRRDVKERASQIAIDILRRRLVAWKKS